MAVSAEKQVEKYGWEKFTYRSTGAEKRVARKEFEWNGIHRRGPINILGETISATTTAGEGISTIADVISFISELLFPL